MITLRGKGVSGGIAIGNIVCYRRRERKISSGHIECVAAEIRRFEEARGIVSARLLRFCGSAAGEIGAARTAIFEAHQMILEDAAYGAFITDKIRNEKICAESAVEQAAEYFASVLQNMNDTYMRDRANDIRDASRRLVTVLTGQEEQEMSFSAPVILAADDLMPSETVRFGRREVLAFAMRKGSFNSHTSILARTMNRPAVIGLGDRSLSEYDGLRAALDGGDGILYIEPDEETLERLCRKKAEMENQRRRLAGLRGKETVTKSGRKISIAANVSDLADIETVLENDADGIGLFRSEFLYMGQRTLPSEEQQFSAYRAAVERMSGRRVVIRTMDIGADKQVDALELEKEANPALGCRGIRFCLTRPELFRTQLRAIYRASAFGEIAMLLPMITSVGEVRQVRAITEEVKRELAEEGVPFCADVELGVMIETPAAVMISRRLAKEADFFSVGTNDLTQYTLAMDRQNPRLEPFYEPKHPAVLEMLRIICENVHAEGKWIGICGELGADRTLTGTFLDMGFDGLSVPPSMVLPLRETVRELD